MNEPSIIFTYLAYAMAALFIYILLVTVAYLPFVHGIIRNKGIKLSYPIIKATNPGASVGVITYLLRENYLKETDDPEAIYYLNRLKYVYCYPVIAMFLCILGLIISQP